MKKKASILIFVILILGLIGFGIGIFISIPDATDLNKQRIHIPRNIQLEEGETIEIVLPITVVKTYSDDVNEVIAETKEAFSQEAVYANEDGSITEILTQEQLEQRIRKIELFLNDVNYHNNNIEVIIDKDLDSATYYVTKDCSFIEWATTAMNVRVNLECAQIYSGVPSEAWQIDDKIVYKDDNVVMFEFHMEEGGNWNISSSEWDTKMQELSKQ